MHRGCTAPCIWVNFSLKGSFMMSILLGQSYLFCFFMGKTKHEPAHSGFGYWDSLKNQKDKSSYLILLFNTQSLPPCSTFMMSESPCPAGLSQSGKLDKTTSIHALLLLPLLWSPRTAPAPRMFSKDLFHSRSCFSLPSSFGEPLVSLIFLSIAPSPCFS